MKRLFIILCSSLMLFSCGNNGETNNTISKELNEFKKTVSENEFNIIGKWKLKMMGSNPVEDTYLVIKEDGKLTTVSSGNEKQWTWSIDGNKFCQYDYDGFESCGTIKLDGNQLEWKKQFFTYVYEKSN